MTWLQVPADLEAWQRWRARRTPLRTLKRSLRPSPEPTRLAWANSADPPRLAVGVAAATTSGRAALVAPLAHLGDTPTLVLAEQDLDHLLPGWHRVPAPAGLPASVRVVLADGHYLGLGHALWRASQERAIPYFIAQHGLITPLAPPLAPGARLLAWTAEDGRFWQCGRGDVSYEVVGSELLWQAGKGARAVTATAPLTYLGQGHAAEISRARMACAALTTCREHGAVYRPHPSERDATSRAVLAAYSSAGITVDASGSPLVDFEGPTVSVFSTGVLEAAARGRDSWVDFPNPPVWLREFWERYAMQRLGSVPTPAPARSVEQPAVRIAEIVSEAAS